MFWSTDSKQLVQATQSGAFVVDVSNGVARHLCDCRFTGGSWNRNGVILLGSAGGAEGIRRVSLNDFTPVQITTVDASRGDHDGWPVFLPDGQHFLFTRVTPGVGEATYVGSLDGGAPSRLADGSRRVFIPSSSGRGAFLAGIDSSGVIVQAFNLDTMTITGTATTVLPGATAVSGSENGVLAASAAGVRPRTIPTWFDRRGASLGPAAESGFIESVALSTNGRKLVVADVTDGAAGQQNDLRVRDLATGANTQLTFNPDNDSTPVWSPDGTRIAYTSRRAGVSLPYQRSADGTGNETPLFPYERDAYANDWSSDGRWLLFTSRKPGSTADNDLWVVSIAGGITGRPVPYLIAPGRQQQAQLSPDGRFVAYGSDQSGAFEIYVQPFPDASQGKWIVSRGGGVEPRWSRDGKALFFFSGQTLMEVPVNLQPTFSNGAPAALFDAAIQAGYINDSHRWQLAPDAKRFLLLTPAGQQQAPPLEVIINWPALLRN